jgi:hypothetical protein
MPIHNQVVSGYYLQALYPYGRAVSPQSLFDNGSAIRSNITTEESLAPGGSDISL